TKKPAGDRDRFGTGQPHSCGYARTLRRLIPLALITVAVPAGANWFYPFALQLGGPFRFRAQIGLAPRRPDSLTAALKRTRPRQRRCVFVCGEWYSTEGAQESRV